MVERPFLPHQLPNLPNLDLYADHSLISTVVDRIRTDRQGGEPLRQAIYQVASLMATCWRKQTGCMPAEDGLTIGIPRGGRYMGLGLHSTVPGYAYLETNDGLDRDRSKPLIDESLLEGRSPREVLIGDTSVLTGDTALRTIQSLSRITGQIPVHYFAALAHIKGLEQIARHYPQVQLHVGQVETRPCQIFDVRIWQMRVAFPGLADIGALVCR